MSRKNALLPVALFTASSMNSNLASQAVPIQFLDNVSIQLDWGSGGAGTFQVSGSLDHDQTGTGSGATIHKAGTFVPLTLSSVPTNSGTADDALLNLYGLAFPWIRLEYTNSFAESVDITLVADSAGSLNSKYFLINGADGTNWYVWYNINSAGVDPAVAGRTGIQVAGATNATAATLATATKAALSACTSITSIGGATSHVTFSMDAPGPGSVADSIPAPTGFTFTYTGTAGLLNAYISGKAI